MLLVISSQQTSQALGDHFATNITGYWRFIRKCPVSIRRPILFIIIETQYLQEVVEIDGKVLDLSQHVQHHVKDHANKTSVVGESRDSMKGLGTLVRRPS
jgi:hypothetical protein